MKTPFRCLPFLVTFLSWFPTLSKPWDATVLVFGGNWGSQRKGKFSGLQWPWDNSQSSACCQIALVSCNLPPSWPELCSISTSYFQPVSLWGCVPACTQMPGLASIPWPGGACWTTLCHQLGLLSTLEYYLGVVFLLAGSKWKMAPFSSVLWGKGEQHLLALARMRTLAGLPMMFQRRSLVLYS